MIVLVADDEPISRRLLEKAVSDLGYEVFVAEDGLAAWNILRQRDVRVLIADWEMPGINGLSLCRRIRTGVLPHYVFVILLTSRTEKQDIITGLEAGADDYLAKPFDPAELRARLRTGQRIASLQRELSAKNEILEDLNGRLVRMALTDPLMEIGNRRGLYDTLSRLQRADGSCEIGYALVMCDVDHFKSYNDACGHIAGDKVLKDISMEMKKCLRNNDGLFRYGGEEIVAYLPGATIERGSDVAQRLCHAVENLKISHPSNPLAVVTVSCGVSAQPEDHHKSLGWEKILSLADQALYQAKSSGRNRVAIVAP